MKVGVLGGGQLGRMLALAGYPLGLRFRFLDPGHQSPAGHVGTHLQGDYEDQAALARFADGLDVVTYEFENVPVLSARWLAGRLPVYPPPAALEAAQDRLHEKRLFQKLNMPVPPFAPVSDSASWEQALRCIDLPVIVKTRRFGYDGKNQWIVRTREDMDHVPVGSQPLIVERLVEFERELSILSVRGRSGEMAFYPLVENHHAKGILRRSLAPAPRVTMQLQALAEGYAARVLEALDYVGVLAIEFFQKEGHLLANEMAPRVHNSGHWTIEGAITSQFENHIRAILGLPLGPTEAIGCSAMLNLIGTVPDIPAILAVPGVHLHLYGKAPRPGRKLGHITVCATGPDLLSERLSGLERLVTAN